MIACGNHTIIFKTLPYIDIYRKIRPENSGRILLYQLYCRGNDTERVLLAWRCAQLRARIGCGAVAVLLHVGPVEGRIIERAGFKLSVKDVFLNMAGGLKVNDPACDLAVISAVLSSNFDFAIPSDVCFAGEVGLSGEIRPVAQTDRRVMEAARIGFRKIYVSSFSNLEGIPENIEVIKVGDVPALCRSLFRNND